MFLISLRLTHLHDRIYFSSPESLNRVVIKDATKPSTHNQLSLPHHLLPSPFAAEQSNYIVPSSDVVAQRTLTSSTTPLEAAKLQLQAAEKKNLIKKKPGK